MKNNIVFRPTLATLLILLIPFLGNLFINGWNWDIADFIIIGTLLFVTGFIVELVNMKVKNNNHRLAVIIAIILVFLYIWAELGVGIFFNFGS